MVHSKQGLETTPAPARSTRAGWACYTAARRDAHNFTTHVNGAPTHMHTYETHTHTHLTSTPTLFLAHAHICTSASPTNRIPTEARTFTPFLRQGGLRFANDEAAGESCCQIAPEGEGDSRKKQKHNHHGSTDGAGGRVGRESGAGSAQLGASCRRERARVVDGNRNIGFAPFSVTQDILEGRHPPASRRMQQTRMQITFSSLFLLLFPFRPYEARDKVPGFCPRGKGKCDSMRVCVSSLVVMDPQAHTHSYTYIVYTHTHTQNQHQAA